MEQVTVQFDYIRKQIHKNAVIKKYADQIEEKTKIHIEYLVAAMAVIPIIMVFRGWFKETITDLVGFAFPFYASMMSIENKDDDRFWLTYWVVYALFDMADNIFDIFLFWLPFYYPLKITFLLWLYLPQTGGCKIVYKAAILPYFKSVEDSVDKALSGSG